MNLQPFRGGLEDNIDEFFDRFDIIAQAKGLRDNRKCEVLPAYLNDYAREIYKGLDAAIRNNYPNLKTALKESFKRPENVAYNLAHLHGRNQYFAESVTANAIALTKLVEAPTLNEEVQKEYLKERSVSGLLPSLRRKVRDILATTPNPRFDDIRQIAQRLESNTVLESETSNNAAVTSTGREDP